MGEFINMEYKNLIIEAINEFPEFAEEYSDEYNVIIGNAESALTMPINLYEFHLQIYEQIMQNDSSPSVYQFFEDIVCRHFKKLVGEYSIDKTNDAICLKITKMLEFFEKMALSGDVEVENVLLVGIFERLLDDKEKLKTIVTLLKEKSRLLIYKCQSYHDVDFKSLRNELYDDAGAEEVSQS